MFHKIKRVKPIRKYELLITFTDDTVKLYNISPLFEKWEVFSSLKTTQGLFEQVRVDVGGYGIIWNDEIDLSCDELWYNGVEVVEDKEVS